jgi:hypothetical protein
MLVDQVEWVPAEENVLVVHLALAEGCEGLVHKVPDVEVNSWLESFLLHPLSTISTSCEALISGNLAKVLDDF